MNACSEIVLSARSGLTIRARTRTVFVCRTRRRSARGSDGLPELLWPGYRSAVVAGLSLMAIALVGSSWQIVPTISHIAMCRARSARTACPEFTLQHPTVWLAPAHPGRQHDPVGRPGLEDAPELGGDRYR